ncbi:MAG: hypothetical protein M1820_002122 [Bogoriella megaspora]|nr:MAG: hypothetical protein M1820_002122 [Bogoriella megaspora]
MLRLGSFLLAASFSVQAQSPKQLQLQQAFVNTGGQIETTDSRVQDNTANSLRAGPRGYNLLEDTTVRKKIQHFDRERAPERVVHALGHGAYGTFQSTGDWSNLTSACWLQAGAESDVFTRFSVVVASNGGSESGHDTHGFATKIYSRCGNQDLVGNHVSSFFINDGADFPDLIHSVKFEADKGFPTGGSAHTTAYDFFTQHPEGTFQLMNVLSDLGIPRDIRHVSGNGVHTFRFLNAAGHRALVYDKATKIAGKNNNFQRIDLFNTNASGIFPEWEFQVQLFPNDSSYMWNRIDLLDPTIIIPFEMNPPMTLGKLTLNKNPTNFFAEPESISFAPSNVVKGVSFVPDPLLQWRLMSYDDTASHRHNSPNGYLLPVNRPIAPIYNNYRDGYMQPLLFEGASTSSPNNIGGVISAALNNTGSNATLPFSGSTPEIINGAICRYPILHDSFGQARLFWSTLDKFAQQHTVDAYHFELGHVSDQSVQQCYIDNILNKVDNCLARRVAMGIGATLPPVGSGPRTDSSTNITFPSLYPLAQSVEPNKSNAGLVIGILADNDRLSSSDLNTLLPVLSAQQVSYEIVGSHIGPLSTGVTANQSFVTTSSIFYDAILFSSSLNSSNNNTNPLARFGTQQFLNEAYGHGKAIAAIGSSAAAQLRAMEVDVNADMGVFEGDAAAAVNDLLTALAGPVRFPQRFPVGDPSICM